MRIITVHFLTLDCSTNLTQDLKVFLRVYNIQKSLQAPQHQLCCSGLLNHVLLQYLTSVTHFKKYIRRLKFIRKDFRLWSSGWPLTPENIQRKITNIQRRILIKWPVGWEKTSTSWNQTNEVWTAVSQSNESIWCSINSWNSVLWGRKKVK